MLTKSMYYDLIACTISWPCRVRSVCQAQTLVTPSLCSRIHFFRISLANVLPTKSGGKILAAISILNMASMEE